MTKEKIFALSEKEQEDIYFNLTRLLSRMDIASNSFSLSSVAMKCQDKLLEEFLDEKPVLNSTPKDFLQSHLYLSSFWGFHNVAQVLIRHGADVNHKNKKTLWTPLHVACFQEHEKVVELLLKNGASVRVKDKGGRSCIDIASVSTKIWPYFKELKCEKSMDDDLIRKGLLRSESIPAQDATPSSARSSSSSQVKLMLSGDDQEMITKISSLRPR